jgi:hypothetical protein
LFDCPLSPLSNGGPSFPLPLMNIKSLLDQPIAYHRAFVQLAGSVNGAVFLSQLFYWSRRTKNKEGWVYKSVLEWTEETGLTRYEQETVKKHLTRRKIIEVKRKGRVPATLHFRINEKQICSLLETSKLDRWKPANKFAEDQQTKTETTAKNTHSASSGKVCGFGITDGKRQFNPYVRRFVKLSIQERWVKDRELTTKRLQLWERSIQELLADQNKEEVKKVFKWFLANHKWRFCPQGIWALTSFCRNYLRIKNAMGRWNEEEGNGEEEERPFRELTPEEIKDVNRYIPVVEDDEDSV